MTTPLEALKRIANGEIPESYNESDLDLMEAIAGHLMAIAKAAIPIAKLHEQAWDAFVQILADIHDYRHLIEENDADIMPLTKKAFDYMLKMEALK